MREKRGLTQRTLARDLGISQNYIPAIEANARQAGPKLQQQMVKYFACAFEDLFQIVLVDPENEPGASAATQGLAPKNPERDGFWATPYCRSYPDGSLQFAASFLGVY